MGSFHVRTPSQWKGTVDPYTICYFGLGWHSRWKTKNTILNWLLLILRLVSYTETPDKNSPDYLPKASTAHEQKLKQLFEAQGFRPEPDPQGNLALGYGCVSVQRRDNWAAGGGHSRYLWAAEHYLDANFFGRYLAHGSMQILTGKSDEMVTLQPVVGRKQASTGTVFPVRRLFICHSISFVPK